MTHLAHADVIGGWLPVPAGAAQMQDGAPNVPLRRPLAGHHTWCTGDCSNSPPSADPPLADRGQPLAIAGSPSARALVVGQPTIDHRYSLCPSSNALIRCDTRCWSGIGQ